MPPSLRQKAIESQARMTALRQRMERQQQAIIANAIRQAKQKEQIALQQARKIQKKFNAQAKLTGNKRQLARQKTLENLRIHNKIALANIKRLQNKFSHVNHRLITNEPSLNVWRQSGVSGTKHFNNNNLAAIARIRAYYRRKAARTAIFPPQIFNAYAGPLRAASGTAIQAISRWK